MIVSSIVSILAAVSSDAPILVAHEKTTLRVSERQPSALCSVTEPPCDCPVLQIALLLFFSNPVTE